MLIDQIQSDPIMVKAGMVTASLRGRFSKATKFVLRRDFAIGGR
jgi:hypothetical protein